MAYCSKCEKELKDEWNFCAGCGTPIKKDNDILEKNNKFNEEEWDKVRKLPGLLRYRKNYMNELKFDFEKYLTEEEIKKLEIKGIKIRKDDFCLEDKSVKKRIRIKKN